jgi:Cupredoxin-like domain
MIVTVVNVLWILAVTAYIVFVIYQRREKLTCIAGMMIAMTLGMMVSLTLGILIGVYVNHDVTKSTILAVVAGLIAGYAAGKPVSLMAAMDGMLAGIMGGMMGAMLGVMLVIPTAMVWFINILFAAVMVVLLQLIKEETGTAKKEESEVKRPFFGSVGMMVGLVALTGVLFVVETDRFGVSQASSHGTGHHSSAQAEITGNVQEATITVSASGYSPQHIEVKAGIPAKIHFQTEEAADCFRQVVSEELGINRILEAGKDNYIVLQDVKPGTYRYTCGMGLFEGTITVKE